MLKNTILKIRVSSVVNNRYYSFFVVNLHVFNSKKIMENSEYYYNR